MFINELKAKQRDYIRKKYMEIDEYLPHESLRNNFIWLYESNYIDRQELQDLFDKLDKKVIIKGF